jgi:hypothetical protein
MGAEPVGIYWDDRGVVIVYGEKSEQHLGWEELLPAALLLREAELLANLMQIRKHELMATVAAHAGIQGGLAHGRV